jgi:hypothetical protein
MKWPVSDRVASPMQGHALNHDSLPELPSPSDNDASIAYLFWAVVVVLRHVKRHG